MFLPKPRLRVRSSPISCSIGSPKPFDANPYERVWWGKRTREENKPRTGQGSICLPTYKTGEDKYVPIIKFKRRCVKVMRSFRTKVLVRLTNPVLAKTTKMITLAIWLGMTLITSPVGKSRAVKFVEQKLQKTPVDIVIVILRPPRGVLYSILVRWCVLNACLV